MIGCAPRLEVIALPDLPLVEPGADLAALVVAGLAGAELVLRDGDVIAVPSKLVSRAQGCFVDLAAVDPSERARRVARRTGKDARLVELVLRESAAVVRAVPGVLIVRHRLGFVVANAGIDASNAAPPPELAARGGGPWVLTLPREPDAAAAALRGALAAHAGGGATIGAVITDSFGRAFRHGTVGVAIGSAGLPPLWDQRGRRDLAGRTLEQTVTALADQVAAAADLVCGQADEGRGAVLVRGLR
ncbi:MAG TPA: coenzyme F420-0:L-glutamate ligase, partial [Kofleriaceae bacterium]|nr:coenzyme F420-0:L-glutamate ligase [Kofleriaceae bacterium]